MHQFPLNKQIYLAWRSQMLDLLRRETLAAELPAPAQSLSRAIAI
jgi:hypothetical protein